MWRLSILWHLIYSGFWYLFRRSRPRPGTGWGGAHRRRWPPN